MFVVVLALQAWAIASTWGAGYWVFGAAAATVVCVLALLRRVWAAGVALAVVAAAIVVAEIADLPSEPSPAMALGLAVTVGSVIRVRPVLPAAVVTAGGFAVVATSWLVSPAQVRTVAVLNALCWLAAIAAGLGLRLLDVRRQEFAENVRRAERLALARELHDVVAHHVTGIVLHAQVVRRRHADQLDESMAGIETASSEALAAMRRVVGLLRDTDDAAPATAGPEQLSDLVSRFEGPAVQLRLPDGEPAWPGEVTTTVYRIVQESLTNIARHAPQARSVTVSVSQDHAAVTVEVTNDGLPARHHRGGYGLVGMRERVEALGGTLRAGPRSGAGWSVHATIPVEIR
ncbi:sensor histidine kinase [Actinophytocola sp.]|uniref:sensor histidine kinase n=1 Tax=Actinophytocola sp. TaxID=1872138 RepID=UPI002ED31A93